MSRNRDTEALREQIRMLERKCREQDDLIQSLRKSNQRFRELVDLLPQNIFEVGLDGTVIYANGSILRCFGCTVESFEGLNAYQMVVPGDRDRMHHNFQERLQHSDRTKVTEYTGLRKDGSTFPISVSAVPIFDGEKPVGLRGVIIDLTERKTVELALRQSELRHRMVLDSMADAIHVVDRDMRIVFMNSVCREWCRKFEMEGEPEGLTPFEIFPFLSPGIRDQYRHVFDSGRPLLTEETSSVCGMDIVTETRKVPIFENGEVRRVMTVVRDVTGSKRAEEQLKKAEQEKGLILDTMSELVFLSGFGSEGNLGQQRRLQGVQGAGRIHERKSLLRIPSRPGKALLGLSGREGFEERRILPDGCNLFIRKKLDPSQLSRPG